MIRAIAIFLFLWPLSALAENLPALYDVFGIEADDKLNVRSGPSTRFDIIGKLEPNETGIELIDTDEPGEWGLINLDGETSGWVSLDYMRRVTGQIEHGLPSNLICYGNEPYWTFRLAQDGIAEFERSDAKTVFENVLTVPSENRTDRQALFADGGDTVITSVIGKGLCSDGMSDRAFGLIIDLLVTDETDVRVYSGCCSIDR